MAIAFSKMDDDWFQGFTSKIEPTKMSTWIHHRSVFGDANRFRSSNETSSESVAPGSHETKQVFRILVLRMVLLGFQGQFTHGLMELRLPIGKRSELS